MRLGATGHRFLPRAVLDQARSRITDLLPDAAIVGVTCLAEGADQLFAETVLQAGGALEVVIPCANYETTFSSPEARRCFHHLLDRTTVRHELPFDGPTNMAFQAAGFRVVDLSDELLAIWDGLPARGPGGTADVVDYARSQGKRVRVIWQDGAKR